MKRNFHRCSNCGHREDKHKKMKCKVKNCKCERFKDTLKNEIV